MIGFTTVLNRFCKLCKDTIIPNNESISVCEECFEKIKSLV